MEDLGGSFRLHRSNSFHVRTVGRSHSSRMLLESSVSSECAQVAKYERLSLSTRSSDEPRQRGPRVGVWRLLTDAFARTISELPAAAYNSKATEMSAEKKEKKKKKKKRWSSWLPDPDRRWPVQGW
ncbi:hypothetical protein Cni_G00966 [Canna indica]|uniref:Uncharacterized protein n=1 Tax=Canna indica TaxID=4628 RepID=A0AAQ3Q0E1_9LILI|nr:hypothetical protein Cni_G00966 [Canna indica]